MPRTLILRTISREPRIMLHVLFEPRDLWRGVYWEPRKGGLHVYVCLVPMLPVKLSIALPPRHIRRLRRWSGTWTERKPRARKRWHTFRRDIPVGRGTLGFTLSLSCRSLYPRLSFREWWAHAFRWRNEPGAWSPDDPAEHGWTAVGRAGAGGRRLYWHAYWCQPEHA